MAGVLSKRDTVPTHQSKEMPYAKLLHYCRLLARGRSYLHRDRLMRLLTMAVSPNPPMLNQLAAKHVLRQLPAHHVRGLVRLPTAPTTHQTDTCGTRMSCVRLCVPLHKPMHVLVGRGFTLRM